MRIRFTALLLNISEFVKPLLYSVDFVFDGLQSGVFSFFVLTQIFKPLDETVSLYTSRGCAAV